MTIEDTIRTEMMRLQQLLGRLEQFKQEHTATKKCAPDNHDWGLVSLTAHEGWETATGTTTCKTCGLMQILSYNLVSRIESDPWPSLRGDEEE